MDYLPSPHVSQKTPDSSTCASRAASLVTACNSSPEAELAVKTGWCKAYKRHCTAVATDSAGVVSEAALCIRA